MDTLLERITELQRLKVKNIESLDAHVTAEATRQFPIFSIRNTSQGPAVYINSANWEFAMFHINDSHILEEGREKAFCDMDKEQLEIFRALQGLVAAELPALAKLLGLDICTAVVCELGSLKRLAEIPSKNLKGVGYVKNSFYCQRSYLSLHPLVVGAQGAKDQSRKLRELCRMVSMTAKLCYFGECADVDTLHIHSRKKTHESGYSAQGGSFKSNSKVRRKLRRRGGRKKRRRLELAAERRRTNARAADVEGVMEDSLSDECGVSTE